MNEPILLRFLVDVIYPENVEPVTFSEYRMIASTAELQ